MVASIFLPAESVCRLVELEAFITASTTLSQADCFAKRHCYVSILSISLRLAQLPHLLAHFRQRETELALGERR